MGGMLDIVWAFNTWPAFQWLQGWGYHIQTPLPPYSGYQLAHEIPP